MIISIQKPHHSDYFHTTKEVKTMAYTTPMIEKIAGYSEATRGVWFGAWRDVLKAKAPFYFDAKL